jgi:hypothetical protein
MAAAESRSSEADVQLRSLEYAESEPYSRFRPGSGQRMMSFLSGEQPPMSDQRLEQEHLAEANRHVAEGEQRVADQKALIEKLASGGHDVTASRVLLATFEDTLRQMIGHRKMILRELEEDGSTGTAG